MRYLFLIFLFLLSSEEDLYNPTTFVFPAYKHTYGIRKAGPTELFLFMGFKVKFRDPEGLACVRLKSWEDPDDPHDDDEQRQTIAKEGEHGECDDGEHCSEAGICFSCTPNCAGRVCGPDGCGGETRRPTKGPAGQSKLHRCTPSERARR